MGKIIDDTIIGLQKDYDKAVKKAGQMAAKYGPGSPQWAEAYAEAQGIRKKARVWQKST